MSVECLSPKTTWLPLDSHLAVDCIDALNEIIVDLRRHEDHIGKPHSNIIGETGSDVSSELINYVFGFGLNNLMAYIGTVREVLVGLPNVVYGGKKWVDPDGSPYSGQTITSLSLSIFNFNEWKTIIEEFRQVLEELLCIDDGEEPPPDGSFPVISRINYYLKLSNRVVYLSHYGSSRTNDGAYNLFQSSLLKQITSIFLGSRHGIYEVTRLGHSYPTAIFEYETYYSKYAALIFLRDDNEDGVSQVYETDRSVYDPTHISLTKIKLYLRCSYTVSNITGSGPPIPDNLEGVICQIQIAEGNPLITASTWHTICSPVLDWHMIPDAEAFYNANGTLNPDVVSTRIYNAIIEITEDLIDPLIVFDNGSFYLRIVVPHVNIPNCLMTDFPGPIDISRLERFTFEIVQSEFHGIYTP